MDVSTSGAVASTASAGSEKKSRAAPSSDRRFGDDWIHIQPTSQRREAQTGELLARDPDRVGKHKHTPCTALGGIMYLEKNRRGHLCAENCETCNNATAPAGAHAAHVGRSPEQRTDSSSPSQAALSATDSETPGGHAAVLPAPHGLCGAGWGAVDEGDATVSCTAPKPKTARV